MTVTHPAGTGLRPEAGAHAGLPFVPSSSRWRPLGLGEVTLDGGFWAERQELNASALIPHVERWVERMGWAGNFDAAAQGRLPGARRGREFSDSEIYKLLEAMAWEVGRTGDADLDARLRRLTARVAAAQEPDGYVNTMFGRSGQGERYSDLQWGHELYCFGHLIQAGVARARTHGDDELVQVAVRAADHVCRQFGPDGDQRVCGHPEIEVALVELYRVTGERRYLDQARAFVDRRGHGVLGDIELGATYYQDDVPVREAEVLAGHAVRALYLAAGAADVATETGDEELLGAVVSQTLATLARRTYLTGGMGAHHEGESFGVDFELPPDRSYSETCAGVASVMLNHRLLLATGDARHADAVERTLFNVVATSPAEDGQAFYYTNTLHQRVPGREVDPDVASPRAASSLRAPFFEVSCCPTNLTRTFASLGAYVASQDEAGVQLHQYAAATVRAHLAGGAVVLRVRTSYPDEGRVEVEVVEAPAGPWELTLRVPAWASGAVVRSAQGARRAEPGYVQVAGPAAGEVVVLELPVAARWTWADPRVDAVRGQVAVERGPVVMALESVDLGADVAGARVRTDVPPVDDGGQVRVPVRTVEAVDGDWPYGDAPAREVGRGAGERLVPLVPYHSWAERGPSTMRVWIPQG
ncbi:glycoside hydrolase family 127 protein [Xylanimonas oleitrophica]|uniref:Glycoside hydrolase family 127 protein n=1 Tax=Xylanimonas oleitrophica TaxID=2607479 RepID=A0A2W5WLA8_9MICO|nr:beta-L-arabinofuranosidase domain-containing protein [Xylanimonas oleitrophica]PZR51812.1 glycoside hydrolase family 127 protein [Xylanimonas oleitrophica]